MQSHDFLVRFADLQSLDGKVVVIRGRYVLHDPLPHLRRSDPMYRPGILLTGDTVPQVFLELPRSEAEMQQFQGKTVTCKGLFHATQPLGEDDPPHSARMSGAWLYGVEVLGE